MGITSYDGLISQFSNGTFASYPLWDDQGVTVSSANGFGAIGRLGYCKQLPNPLPSGVTGYIATKISLTASSAYAALVGWQVNLGSFNVSTASFTAGSSMPTRTELGTSNVLSSPLFIECSTGFAAGGTPGTITVTYTSQAGTAGQTLTQILPASLALRSVALGVLSGTDTGVQSISGVTVSGQVSPPTGIVTFYGMIPITIMPISASSPLLDNLITQHFNPMSMPAGFNIAVYCWASNQLAKGLFGEIIVVGNS